MTQSRPEPKVIVIPAKEESPQDQEKKKNLRVAAYCRVSTKKDEQLGSYENQKAYYTEKIMANPNWTMADIFCGGNTGCFYLDDLRIVDHLIQYLEDFSCNAVGYGAAAQLA